MIRYVKPGANYDLRHAIHTGSNPMFESKLLQTYKPKPAKDKKIGTKGGSTGYGSPWESMK